MRGGKSIIVITGVPGTGKTTLADRLARKLKSAEVIHVTEIVNKERIFTSYSKDGAKVADMGRLKRRIEQLASESDRKVIIIESHLLCDIGIKGALAVVLREHLPVIKRRLEKRGYGREKLNGDLISEATDYCGIRAERNYSYVFETFARDPKSVTNTLSIIAGRRPKSDNIDLLPELADMIKKDRSLLL
jgi:broad-specificity NMP kinase